MAQLHLNLQSDVTPSAARTMWILNDFFRPKRSGGGACLVSKFAAENQLSDPAVCSGIAAKQFIWPATKALNILLPVEILRQNQTRRIAFYDFIHHFPDILNKLDVEKLKRLGSINSLEYTFLIQIFPLKPLLVYGRVMTGTVGDVNKK